MPRWVAVATISIDTRVCIGTRVSASYFCLAMLVSVSKYGRLRVCEYKYVLRVCTRICVYFYWQILYSVRVFRTRAPQLASRANPPPRSAPPLASVNALSDPRLMAYIRICTLHSAALCCTLHYAATENENYNCSRPRPACSGRK